MATLNALSSGLLRAAISVDTTNKITDYITIKAPPTVVSQTPAAGTPVIQGMTIEVKATSLSDVPWHIIDASSAAAIKNVPVADIKQLVESDATLSAAVKAGTISDSDLGTITAKLNTGLANSGLSGELNSTDATNLIKSLGSSGLINV